MLINFRNKQTTPATDPSPPHPHKKKPKPKPKPKQKKPRQNLYIGGFFAFSAQTYFGYLGKLPTIQVVEKSLSIVGIE